MAENSTETPSQAPEERIAKLLDMGTMEVWIRPALYTLAVIVALFLGYSFYKNNRETVAARDNSALAHAYIFIQEKKLDSAESALSAFLSQKREKIAEAKANLMLGNILYSKERFDDALSRYQSIQVGDKYPIISAGALYGVASVLIDKQDYKQAVSKLESFLSRFMRRPPPEKRSGDGDEQDLSPAVPNVLWKLALCHRELKQNDQAKATLEKLSNVYPEAPESRDALRLLAGLNKG